MAQADRPTILVGSSVEGLGAATAIQSALEYDARVVLWTDDVMRLSQDTIASLTEALRAADFAILVATADDETSIRGSTYASPRDNVILELGLAIGMLGPERTFLVTPRDNSQFRLATDLLGYEPATFDPTRVRTSRDWSAVMGPAVRRIRLELEHAANGTRPRVREWSFYNELARTTPERVARAREMDFYFIHSRRWREDNADALRTALARPDTTVRVYLPDMDDATLVASLQRQFSDGEYVPALVADGFHYWAELLDEAAGSLSLFLFNAHPTYTIYRIDDFVLTALYPATRRKRNVPALVHDHGDGYWQFVQGDLDAMSASGPLSRGEVQARARLRSPWA